MYKTDTRRFGVKCFINYTMHEYKKESLKDN